MVGKRERLLFHRETFSGREKRGERPAVRDSAMLWTRKSYVKREMGYYTRLASPRLVSRLRSKEREEEEGGEKTLRLKIRQRREKRTIFDAYDRDTGERKDVVYFLFSRSVASTKADASHFRGIVTKRSPRLSFHRFIDIPWSVLVNSVGKIGGGKRRYGKSSIALLSRISV